MAGVNATWRNVGCDYTRNCIGWLL
jgi:hypothetical protein